MTEDMLTLAKPLTDILANVPDRYDMAKIEAAYVLAYHAHEGQCRQSGEPYICHPIAVAASVASLGLDTDSVCAALLHDTVEDCEGITAELLCERFGKDVATIVEGVTKIVSVSIEDREEAQIENIRKMMLAISKDIRVIIVKLCDRLHNMRTLGGKKNSDRQREIALETMYVYAPLAHRLGMQRIKLELENLALYYLDPIGYAEVTEAIDRRFGTSRELLASARTKIEERVASYGIKADLEDRIKSVYSLYRKIYELGKPFEEIYDFYALRLIVDTVEECYMVLGIVHEMFTSIPGRFKDYISMPKPNMYRSLHTTVMSRDGIPFEVQIRTHEMHETAEFGIAAHWRYKTGEAASKKSDEVDKQLAWIASLIEADEGTRDPDEYIHSFKGNLFREEIFVFTPKGDVISLPRGATVIDFAYTIHTAVGNKMVGAKINGVIVPIDRVPQTGDVVEILTQNNKGPSRDWLNIVTTSEARGKIRQWFKKEKRPENIELGREMLERELRRLGHAFTPSETNEIFTATAERMGMATLDDLFDTVGYGGLTLSRVAVRLKEESAKLLRAQATATEAPKTADEAAMESIKEKSRVRASKKQSGGVIVDGAEGCLIKFARCCNPLPGDSIIGFVTRGFGVSVHKRDCPNAVSGVADTSQASRWLSAHWEQKTETQSEMYEASVSILTEDKIGVLADVSIALAEMKIPVHTINVAPPKDGKAIIHLTVGCKNTEHYNAIVARLRAIPTVIRITRN